MAKFIRVKLTIIKLFIIFKLLMVELAIIKLNMVKKIYEIINYG